MSAATNPRTSAPDFPPEFLNNIEYEVMARSGRAKGNNEIVFRCPMEGHKDNNPSASYNTEKHTWTCRKCSPTGREAGALHLADLLGIDKPEHRRNGPTLKAVPPPNLTLAEYAAAKGLPERFLRSIGCTDAPYLGGTAVRMVYPDDDGGENSVRYRISLKKTPNRDRFLWQKGSKALPYGLDRIPDAEQAGRILLLEGESCTQTSWYRGFPALGIPGVANWKDERDAPHLANIPVIYAVIEPDGGGDTFRAKLLASSSLRDRLYFIDLSPYGVKDVSDLYLDDPDTFDERMEEAIAAATPATEWAMPHSPADKMPVIFPTTDTGNAERLVHHHGQNLRYIKTHKAWMVFTKTHWARDDTGLVDQLAKETVRAIPDEASDLDRDVWEKHLRWAITSESGPKRTATIELARSEKGIPARPEDFDRDPWLLNVQNGTLDLRTGKLRPHDRGDLISKLAPVDYDPSATCPVFLEWLSEIMLGRADLVTFLQRAMGYSLTGKVSERVVFILHGGGRNGKTTLLETVGGILDDYAGTAPAEMLLAKRETGIPNDVARLPGSRFVSATETGEGRRLDEVKVKSISGGDTIQARFMHADWFDFRPTFKIWLGTNHKPEIRGTDNAIWDRIRLIPFDYRVSDDQKISDLSDRFIAQEASGILAWMVEGCLAWQRHGLGTPREVMHATNAYRAEMDALASWIEDRCDVRNGARASAKALYEDYVTHCKSLGEEPIPQRTFGGKLKERGFVDGKSGSVRYWTGIRLLDPNEPTQTTFSEDDTSQSPHQWDATRDDMSHQKAYESGDSDDWVEHVGHMGRDFRGNRPIETSSRNNPETNVPYVPYVPNGEVGDDPWTR